MLFRNEKWVNVRTLRRELSHWISEAAYGGLRVIVALHGKPRAALVSLRDLNRLRDWQPDRAWRDPDCLVRGMAEELGLDPDTIEGKP